MGWLESHVARQVTAAEAAARIRRGQWVTTGLVEARAIMAALAARTDVEDVTLFLGESVFGGVFPFLTEAARRRFRVLTAFLNPHTQAAHAAGHLEFVPAFFSTGSKVFREGYIRCDVALVQVTPPDAHGWCSLGLSVDYIKGALDHVPVVMAEVNPLLPRTRGDTLVHASRFDCWVEAPVPPPVLPGAPERPEWGAIAAHLNELVPDGATIQAGQGDVVDAAVARLERYDLGIHSEMFTNGLMALMQRGVATGARKTLLRDRAVATMAFGSEELYQFVRDNPGVELHPAELVLDPMTIARNHRMVAINTALQVDLLGQVNAEALATRQVSGVGGQTDFARGAAMCPGGLAVLILPATARRGTVSNIVPALPPGTPVTATRSDMHVVVTEYGVARLIGRSTRERVRDLIAIAHPDHRGGLAHAARQAGLL